MLNKATSFWKHSSANKTVLFVIIIIIIITITIIFIIIIVKYAAY